MRKGAQTGSYEAENVRMSKTDQEFQKLESPSNYDSGFNKANSVGKMRG